MAQVKCWVLTRVLGELDEEGNAAGAYIAEVMSREIFHVTDMFTAFAPLPLNATICECGPMSAGQANTLEGLNRYLVMVVRYTSVEENGELAGTFPEGFEPDEPIAADRWTDKYKPAGIYMGFTEAQIDGWKVTNPDATPRDFYNKMKQVVENSS